MEPSPYPVRVGAMNQRRAIMNNWAGTRLELDHVLDLERALVRQRRQQQWQRFLQEGKHLRAFLVFCLMNF